MAVEAVELCSITRDYRLRLLQLPCHQDLSEAEMNWMIDDIQCVSPKELQLAGGALPSRARLAIFVQLGMC
jgi:hypothetical protein